jgi:UDP-N-acetylglucosamine 4,6-dehydratase
VGSRGSVIPFFLKERAKGVLPITDPRMTRFWITLEQGVQFVLDCLDKMVGGELFVPKLPSMNIMDLARVIAPECETKVVGIRPGEKIHEVMISKDDARRTIEFDSFYMVQPDFRFWTRRANFAPTKAVPEDFEYNSGSNPRFLTVDQMKDMIQKL